MMGRWMRLVRSVSVLLLAAGCAPGHQAPPEVVPATTRIVTDSSPSAPLFDSLAHAAGLPQPMAPGAAFDAQANQSLAWIDVLRDTALVALVRTALRDNRDIHGALGRIAEYRALAGVARSALLPELDATATASRNRIVFAGTPVEYTAIGAAASLQWELDFWGRIRKGVAAAEADQAARADDERALVLTLVADVSTSYLALLEARENRDIAERTLGSRQTTVGLARQRYAQGVISELDVRQFEADVAGAAASVAQFTRDASTAEHQLALLLGHAPGEHAGGGTLDSAVAAVAVPDSVPVWLLLRRPDVASAARSLEAEQARYGVTRASTLPRVMITGQYGWQAPSAANIFTSQNEIYTAQVGVSVPIFTGGRISSNLAAGRARIEQAQARYEQSVLTALNEAADALVGVRTGRDQLSAQADQVVALRDAFRLAERRYEGGIASYLEVLDAQRGLFAAELALTQSRRNYLEATVRLYQALGGRWDVK